MGLFDRLLGKPTPRSFAEKLIDRIRRADPSAELRYEPEARRIVRLVDGEVAGVIHLDNLFRTYAEAPRAQREDYLGVCVRSALVQHRELPEDFESATPDLRPRLWARASFEQMRLKARAEGSAFSPLDLPGEPVGDHLLATLVYDWPEAVQSIGAGDLDRWDVSIYEAMEVARRNLGESETGYAKIGDSLFAFMNGDSYDASRLLLVDRLADLETDGRPIALVPNRNSLLIAGEDDPDGLEMLLVLGAKQLEEPYSLSGVPLVLEDGVWVDWRPPDGHPLAPKFHDLELRWLGPLYNVQKEALDAAHEAEGDGPFVASFSAVQKPDGSLVSYCVWGEGVESLLPVTRKVVFMARGKSDPVAVGDWETVAAVLKDRLEPTDEYPPRYLVREFPSPDQIAAIGVTEL